MHHGKTLVMDSSGKRSWTNGINADVDEPLRLLSPVNDKDDSQTKILSLNEKYKK